MKTRHQLVTKNRPSILEARIGAERMGSPTGIVDNFRMPNMKNYKTLFLMIFFD